MNETIGDRIKEARKFRKQTQKDLAEKIDVSANYIYLIESGRESPGKKTVADICRVLKACPDWIADGLGPKYVQSDPYGDLINELITDKDNPLYSILIAIMKTYGELEPNSQRTVREFAQKLKESINKEGQG